MTDLDALLRAADPAARLTPPEPGRPPVLPPPSRRRTPWLPAAAAAGVVAVLGAAAVGLGLRDGGPAAAGAPVTASVAAPVTATTARPSPTGSAAATPTPTSTGAEVAGSGPDRERVVRLLGALRAVVPAGYGTPSGKVPAGLDGAPIDGSYAQAARIPGKPVTGLIYDVNQFVTAGKGIGSVGVTVFDGVPAWGDDPCVIFDRLKWYVGDCTEVRTASGLRVGVSVWKVGGDPRGSRFALHRHPDGTAVLVSQTNGTNDDRGAVLPALPFSDARLAQLATDPAFAR